MRAYTKKQKRYTVASDDLPQRQQKEQAKNIQKQFFSDSTVNKCTLKPFLFTLCVSCFYLIQLLSVREEEKLKPYIIITKILLTMIAPLMQLFYSKFKNQKQKFNLIEVITKLLLTTYCYWCTDIYERLIVILQISFQIAPNKKKIIIKNIISQIFIFIQILSLELRLIGVFVGSFLIIIELIELLQFFLIERKIKKQRNNQQNNNIANNINGKKHQSLEGFSKISNLFLNIKLEKLPLGAFVVNKQTQQISQFNNALKYIFKDLDDDDEISVLIFEKLEFQLIRHQKKKKPILSNFSQSYALVSRQKQSLDDRSLSFSEILNIRSSDAFNEDEYLDPVTKTLDFYAYRKVGDEIQHLLIKFQEDNQEITSIIIDITKHNHISGIQQIEKFKQKVVSSFSHELRTPLNSGQIFLQAALQDPQITQNLRENYIIPVLSCFHIQNYLISDIIDFSQFHANTFKLHPKKFYLHEIIDEIFEIFKSLLDIKKLELFTSIAENVPNQLNTDYSRLIIPQSLQIEDKYNLRFQLIRNQILNFQQLIQVINKSHYILLIGLGMDYTKLIKIQNNLNQISNLETHISKQNKWYGFGFIIVQTILVRIAPTNNQQLLVYSDGVNKGTTVTFFIKNFNILSESYIKQNDDNDNFRSRKGTFFPILRLSYNQDSQQNNAQNRQSPQRVQFSERDQNDQIDLKEEQSYQSECVLQKDDEENGIQILQQQISVNINFTQNKSSLMDQKLSSQCISQQRRNSDELLLQQVEVKRNGNCKCKRILTVDDEGFNQKSLQLLISREGYIVLQAYNGQECVDLILQKNLKCCSECKLFDLILMDCQMPVMDGWKTTMKLRRLMKDNQIPNIMIVGLTAFNSEKDVQKCIQAGMDQVLSKPLKMKEFNKIIQNK